MGHLLCDSFGVEPIFPKSLLERSYSRQNFLPPKMKKKGLPHLRRDNTQAVTSVNRLRLSWHRWSKGFWTRGSSGEQLRVQQKIWSTPSKSVPCSFTWPGFVRMSSSLLKPRPQGIQSFILWHVVAGWILTMNYGVSDEWTACWIHDNLLVDLSTRTVCVAIWTSWRW